MEGIQFVRGDHLSIADGICLPYADLLGHVDDRLHELTYAQPQLKPYIPRLLDVDVFIAWDGDRFLLLVSDDKRGHLPARGIETKHLPALREAGQDLLPRIEGFLDVSDMEPIKQNFDKLGFSRGFAAVGEYPLSEYTEEATARKNAAGMAVAQLLLKWAEARRKQVEGSKIFLSHRGINKPLVERIDRALKQLGLSTWFDRDDIAAGDPLLRTIDAAFSECSAAVFFISADYLDQGVIGREIDKAIHEQTMRNGEFRIIPLVLRQHGGNDGLVPSLLETLAWKTVDDVDIVPTILRALPARVQALVKYTAAK